MPPSLQTNSRYQQDSNPGATGQLSMSANDQTYCASIQELPTLTPEELSARIQSLVWLTTPGNGASVEAVAKFKKELDRLRMLQDQKERIVA